MFSSNDSFLRPLWQNGPTPGKYYNFPGSDYSDFSPETVSKYGRQRASQPITTGTSVVGLKFDGGIMIAADNLVSYGSLARFQDVQRVHKINERSVIGCGGEFADFQWIKRHIDQKVIEDTCYNDELETKPKSLYTWLTRVLYNRRGRFQPLWIDVLIGGMEDGEPFLGHIDMRGRSYEDKIISTGFGKYLAVPLIREHLGESELPTKEKAAAVLKKTMEVLFYRDCKALSKYSVAVCTAEGTVVHKDLTVNQNWHLAEMVVGY